MGHKRYIMKKKKEMIVGKGCLSVGDKLTAFGLEVKHLYCGWYGLRGLSV